MDPLLWLAEQARLRIPAQAFDCLEDCGFCCTYPPAVQSETFEAIRASTGLTTVGVDPDGTKRLPLQGGCGGCVLLKDRVCTDYDHRPLHCRLFPFHLYFGRTNEVYANRVCPGLDHTEGGPEALATGTQVREATWEGTGALVQSIGQAVSTVDIAELEANTREAQEVHAQFERIATAEGVWGDIDQERGRQIPATRITEEAWSVAMGPFLAEEDAQLPTMVLGAPGFEWRAWRLEDDRFIKLRFEEGGAMEAVGECPLPSRPSEPSPGVQAALERLAGYECFVGSAYELVDFADYEHTVPEAVRLLLSEVAASLAIREHLLEAEGLPAHPGWLAAAYEPEFYDLPTIGAWL